MPIYYCKMPEGNVGDDINEFIWSHYIDIDKLPDDNLMIGIGSLLNGFIPDRYKSYTVISSGVGYGKPPVINENWNVLCVRGDISKAKLGISDDTFALDGAYLLKDCYTKPKVESNNLVGYVPHVASLSLGDWPSICELAGLKFIDPRLCLKDFLIELCGCEKVLSEAMHGAILADIYQIPWKPIKAYHHINTEKWDDWLSVFGERAHFSQIDSIWNGSTDKQASTLKNRVKQLIFLFAQPQSITPPVYHQSSDNRITQVAEDLKSYAKGKFFLNNSELIDKKVSQLKTLVHDFNKGLS